MIGETGFHCRGDPQRLVDPAEVIVNKVDSRHLLVILYLLLKAFASRGNWRIDIRMVRFWRRLPGASGPDFETWETMDPNRAWTGHYDPEGAGGFSLRADPNPGKRPHSPSRKVGPLRSIAQ